MKFALLPLLLVFVGPSKNHSLDPLTAQEIARVSGAVNAAGLCDACLFPFVSLREPPKGTLGGRPKREGLATVLDLQNNRVFEVVVDIASGNVVRSVEQPGAQPLLMLEEFSELPRIVRADKNWQEAMLRRGISDFENVHVDAWAQGYDDEYRGQPMRVLRALSFYRGEATNMYGRPVEGVVAVVDMTRRVVLSVVDSKQVPLAPDTFDFFDPEWIGKQRAAPAPLTVEQPAGPGFVIDGPSLRWQNWRMRWKMEPREGLVVYDVHYEDNDRPRSVLYRASLSEMVVPYGDPDPAWRWRSAFDVGEYGIGRLATPLLRGADVPNNAVLMDVDFADDYGKPYRLPAAVAIYERDGGVLWKHYDLQSQQNAVRRARELVLTFSTTVGNYDYALSWIFGQDGAIHVEADLMGIMLAKGVSQHETPPEHAHVVAPGVAAPHHQHFFTFRLDLDVDGAANSLVELNTTSRVEPSLAGDRRSIVMEESELSSELQARRNLSLENTRRWAVLNRNVENALGSPTGYALLPGGNTVPYVWPESSPKAPGCFIDFHVWGTRYHPEEIYAAGDYPNYHQGTDGLPAWVLDDEPLSGNDIVFWYTMGVTHIPRPEEWPVMPNAKVGFTLQPLGFFSRNPALDVPASPQ